MQPLPETFTRGDYHYRMVERTDKTAIFEQLFEGTHVAFEAILIKKEKERNIMGKKYPPAEVFPSTEKWGTYGFTTHTLENARARAAQLEGSKFGQNKK